jgi:microsomal dipeptidase-like Zn-dependent dipeptidase
MVTLPGKNAALALATAAACVFGQNTTTINIPIRPLPQPASLAIWGFADLHTHPASFLGFGATSGMNGLIWGKPAHDGAMDLATSIQAQNLASDMPPCPTGSVPGIFSGPTHNNNAGPDPITLITDGEIVSILDQTAAGFTHQQSGSPDFQSWPAARTVDHQVMHIDNIHRAYQGGLRLMFAAATDDELITKVWNQGINVLGNPMPSHNPSAEWDSKSAANQLTYIQSLVGANSSWMQIVSTPAEARSAIVAGKLAVVLSLEMDELSLSDITSLVQTFHVAHVIPIHLADNSFGGTAVYSDFFNGLSNFINGSPESTSLDPNVNFMLGLPVTTIQEVSPSTLQQSMTNLTPNEITLTTAVGDVLAGLVTVYGPTAVAAASGATLGAQIPQGVLGYLPILPTSYGLDAGEGQGEINTRDLDAPLFYQLMEMGLMLDVAHMGQKTAATALTMAQQYNYPLMDSHTGIRCDNANLVNGKTTSGFAPVACGAPFAVSTITAGQIDERSLPASQVAVIQKLGGVIGLGVTELGPDPVAQWINNYSALLNLMGGKGVALGTDADGLSPMIPNDTILMNYPVTVAATFGCPSGCPVSLPQYTFGGRLYNFSNDGIANYGMLPDFIQAASQPRSIPPTPNPQCIAQCYKTSPCIVASGGAKPVANCGPYNTCTAKCPTSGGGMGAAPTAQVTALFHSAEDTIEMWEKVAATVLINAPNLSLNQSGGLVSTSTGEQGQPFSQTLTATGGTPPYIWTLPTGSSLPPGLTLSQGGVISGTGTTAGTFNFTVQVHDSATPAATNSQAFTFEMAAEPCLQNPSHKIISCGAESPQTCVVPPAGCPTCPSGEELIGGACITKPVIINKPMPNPTK